MACALNKHPHRSHLRVRAHHQVVNIQRSCSSSIPCSPTPRVRAQLVLSSPTLRSLRCPRRQPSPVSPTAKTTQLLPRHRLSNKPSTMVQCRTSHALFANSHSRSLTHRVNLRVSRWPLCLTLTFSLARLLNLSSAANTSTMQFHCLPCSNCNNHHAPPPSAPPHRLRFELKIPPP
jgi:hypothetical protein